MGCSSAPTSSKACRSPERRLPPVCRSPPLRPSGQLRDPKGLARLPLASCRFGRRSAQHERHHLRKPFGPPRAENASAPRERRALPLLFPGHPRAVPAPELRLLVNLLPRLYRVELARHELPALACLEHDVQVRRADALPRRGDLRRAEDLEHRTAPWDPAARFAEASPRAEAQLQRSALA